MNNYIDYTYYHNTFGGDLIPQNKFDKIATITSSKVRNRIFNRDITGYENKVKNATCLVAELYYTQELNKDKLKGVIDGTDAIITSEKVGDYSRNISNINFSKLQKITSNEYFNQEMENILEENLLYTNLLYVGINNV